MRRPRLAIDCERLKSFLHITFKKIREIFDKLELISIVRLVVVLLAGMSTHALSVYLFMPTSVLMFITPDVFASAAVHFSASVLQASILFYLMSQLVGSEFAYKRNYRDVRYSRESGDARRYDEENLRDDFINGAIFIPIVFSFLYFDGLGSYIIFLSPVIFLMVVYAFHLFWSLCYHASECGRPPGLARVQTIVASRRWGAARVIFRVLGNWLRPRIVLLSVLFLFSSGMARGYTILQKEVAVEGISASGTVALIFHTSTGDLFFDRNECEFIFASIGEVEIIVSGFSLDRNSQEKKPNSLATKYFCGID